MRKWIVIAGILVALGVGGAPAGGPPAKAHRSLRPLAPVRLSRRETNGGCDGGEPPIQELLDGR
jgi:hypothetical protein